MQLGERIRLLRNRAHKTQQQIADEAKISRQTLDALENGRETNPGLETLIAISTACGAVVSDLFPGKTAIRSSLDKIEIAANEENAVLFIKLREVFKRTKRRETILRAVIERVHAELPQK